MNNIAQTRMINTIISEMNDENQKMQYYLRNTSNVGRPIVYVSEAELPVEMHLLNLEGFADAAQSVRSEDFPR